uniref:CDP-diacylglycerol--glycerol-3-phosphate 3-phosphatidyltransferase n=1 Tax=Syphacia muris TaxID=451379 RepID=A0A158R4G8_9BILA
MHEVLPSLTNNGSFTVPASSIHIIDTPEEFYNCLLELAKNVRNRITLSTLYIGDGPLEQAFVEQLRKSINDNSDLSLEILIDYFRGTRGGEKSSVALLKRLLPRASVCLFHTPTLRGFLKRILPERSNEIIGLQHMKLYIFDDSVVISGANLSETYFTNRQDRYIRIDNCKELADFLDKLVKIVQSFSFRLKPDGSLVLHEKCEVHPSDGSAVEYWEIAHSRLFNHIKSLPVNENTFGPDTTRIFPLIQMGIFGIDQEHKFLTDLFGSKNTTLKITVASGYLNFVDEYISLISKVGTFSMDVIFASPQANGFHEGSGLSRYIPAMYVNLSKHFFNTVRSNVRLFEYSRPLWSFHGKGLWISSTSSDIAATLVGSSNYGFRSLKRDLELQLLIVTNNEKLKTQLNKVDFRGIPVYRFQNIVIGSIIARLKLLQTIIAAAVVPYYFWKYGLGEVQLERCLLISGLAIFAIGMLVAATRYFNRLIGVISMNQTNEVIRVGYLSFWGSRRNQIIPVKDVVPISDSDSNPNDVIVKFCRYSTPKFLYLSRIKSEIVDKERAELLFGDLTIFKNKAC